MGMNIMNTKQTLLWAAMAASSVMLVACGGDSSSSSSSGLSVSVKDLNYTGLETAAVIDSDNYLEIGTTAHQVALKLIGADYFNTIGMPYASAVQSEDSNVSNAQVADIASAIYQDLKQKRSRDPADRQAVSMPVAAMIGGGSADTEKVEWKSVDSGMCGGTLTREGVETRADTEADTEDFYTETDSTESNETAVYNDYCMLMWPGSIEVTVNGRIESTSSSSERYRSDESGSTTQEINNNRDVGSLTLAFNGKSVRVDSTGSRRYFSDYDGPASEYDPATFVDESKYNYAIIRATGSTYFSEVSSCEVDESDLSETICVSEKLFEIGNKVYKYEGFFYGGGNIGLEPLFMPDYGYMDMTVDGSYPVLCAEAAGFSTGNLAINGGEITLDYPNCSEVTIGFGGNSETIDQ